MANIRLPYIALRQRPDGSIRPRFQPGPTVRALGFKNADLKHPDGRWFTLDEARGFAEARHAEIEAVRASGKKLRMPQGARRRTVEDLLEDFLRSGKFKRPRAEGGYSQTARDDYRKKADVIIWKPRQAPPLSATQLAMPRRAREADRRAQIAAIERRKEEFAQSPAALLEPGTIHNDEDGGFFGYLRRERGLSTARGAIMVLSAAYKWARKASAWQLTHNPCEKLGLPKPKPQPVTFTYEEFQALVRYGDHPAIDEIDIVDAAFLALFSGQRPGDVLAYDGVGTVDGVTRLVQSKRGRHVAVPQLPPLVARLAAMAERRKAAGWTCDSLIVNHHTGQPFVPDNFRHRFAALVAMVAAGRPDLELDAVPSIAGKQFKFLRKTMLTWLKRARVPDYQFAAVSGHSLASLPQVMPHYAAPGSEDADAAMTAVWDWMQKQGMTG